MQSLQSNFIMKRTNLQWIEGLPITKGALILTELKKQYPKDQKRRLQSLSTSAADMLLGIFNWDATADPDFWLDYYFEIEKN